jgi:hypothetical protein
MIPENYKMDGIKQNYGDEPFYTKRPALTPHIFRQVAGLNA